MKHKHHIIPRHEGGSDDSSNLIELTIEEHAEAHRLLYEEYNRREDYIAWKSLSGLLNKQEIVLELCSLAGKKQGKINADSGHLKRIAQLPNNRNSGMIWITNGIKNKMIGKEDVIYDGWKKGKTQKNKV